MGNMVMSNLYLVLLMYVVIDRGQLAAWSVVSGGM
jgi:hypothetical protein